MIKHYRLMIQLIRGKVKRYLLSENVKTLAESAPSVFLRGQGNIFVGKSHFSTKDITEVTAQPNFIQHLTINSLEPSAPLPKKIIKWWGWYSQLTGLDTVEAAKQQITIVQEKLFKCQDNRIILNKQMTDVTLKLQEVYGELIQTKRDNPKYVQLTIVENKTLQEQNKIIDMLKLLEKEEKDKFTQLTTAIKEYHESQNINTQKFKYISIISSVVITMVSLIGAIIFNNWRIWEMKNTIHEAQGKNEYLISANTNQLSDLQKSMQQFEVKLFQKLSATKEKEVSKESNNVPKDNGASNILITSAKYVAYTAISGVSYVTGGIYAGGSYVARMFTR